MEFTTETQFQSDQKTYNLKLIVTETDPTESSPKVNGLFDLFKGVFGNLNGENKNKDGLKGAMDKIVEYIQANNKQSEEDKKKEKPRIEDLVGQFTDFFESVQNKKPEEQQLSKLLTGIAKTSLENSDMSQNGKELALSMIDHFAPLVFNSPGESCDSSQKTNDKLTEKINLSEELLGKIKESVTNKKNLGNNVEPDDSNKKEDRRGDFWEKVKEIINSSSFIDENMKEKLNNQFEVTLTTKKNDRPLKVYLPQKVFKVTPGKYALNLKFNPKIKLESFYNLLKWGNETGFTLTINASFTKGISQLELIDTISHEEISVLSGAVDEERMKEWIMVRVKDYERS